MHAIKTILKFCLLVFNGLNDEYHIESFYCFEDLEPHGNNELLPYLYICKYN